MRGWDKGRKARHRRRPNRPSGSHQTPASSRSPSHPSLHPQLPLPSSKSRDGQERGGPTTSLASSSPSSSSRYWVMGCSSSCSKSVASSSPSSTLMRLISEMAGVYIAEVLGHKTWSRPSLCSLPTRRQDLTLERKGIYGTAFMCCWLPLLSTYLLIYLSPRSLASPPHDPPPSILSRLVVRLPFPPFPTPSDNRVQVYECSDEEGTPTRCFEDDCHGSFRPLRARHCRDCGRCQSVPPPLHPTQPTTDEEGKGRASTTIAPG